MIHDPTQDATQHLTQSKTQPKIKPKFKANTWPKIQHNIKNKSLATDKIQEPPKAQINVQPGQIRVLSRESSYWREIK